MCIRDRIKEPMSPSRYVRSGCLAGLLLAPLALFGQLQTGEIRLEVKDQSGSAMRAAGTLESISAGIRRTYETDGQGAHIFGSLPFGRYRLQVGQRGFATQEVLIEVRSAIPVPKAVTL